MHIVRASATLPLLDEPPDLVWRFQRVLGSYVMHICACAHARAHHCTTQEPSTQGPKTPDLANVFINETRLLALIGKQFILFKFAGSAYIQYVLVAHS